MREIETTVTTKGQVTIPVEIRTQLGLKPKDKVQFELDGDSVRLKKSSSRIQRHFGAVRLEGEVPDWRAERVAFEQGVAEEVDREG